MSDACEREQRSENCASPKTASGTPSMTLASAALESQTHNTAAGQQQQQEILSMATGGGSGSSSTGPSAAGRQQQQQQQQLQLQQLLNESDMRELREIKQLLWGDSVREDVFKRWSQGKFSLLHHPHHHGHHGQHHPKYLVRALFNIHTY